MSSCERSKFFICIDTLNVSQFLMVNKAIIDGEVCCARETCKHKIGQMRFDNIHVLLHSFRKGRLDHCASVSERGENSLTSVVINRLTAENEVFRHAAAADTRALVSVNPTEVATALTDATGPKTSVAETDNSDLSLLKSPEPLHLDHDFLSRMVEDIIATGNDVENADWDFGAELLDLID